MITVACVLKAGGVYTDGHVARLHGQVVDYLKIPFWFVCLSDVKVPCDRIRLMHGWPGYWSKLELFTPKLFSGRVLYLDLDVTIRDDLAPFIDYPYPFAIIKDWTRRGYNSSVIVWDAGYADRLYAQFSPTRMEEFAGDQDWINETMPGAATFPLGWACSFKASGNRIPAYAKVIVYHGRPKPPGFLDAARPSSR